MERRAHVGHAAIAWVVPVQGNGEKYYVGLFVSHLLYTLCLSACLFGFGAQTIGLASTKFGMDHPLGPVGNLKLFLVDFFGGGIWMLFNGSAERN